MIDTFADLPDALVRDLLAQAMPVAEEASRHLESLRLAREPLRQQIRDRGLVCRKADLDVPREPSVVGIDGSYQAHRMTALDLCAAAAVAVEGTIKEGKHKWGEPHHRFWARSLEHSKNATNTLRGLMIAMELELAAEAPHDLVLLDGSFIVLVIYLNQGLNSFSKAPARLRDEFMRYWDGGVLDRFLRLISSDRTVAVPKYSSRNELISVLDYAALPPTDGKTLATILLEPDEYTSPMPIYRDEDEVEEYHLRRARETGEVGATDGQQAQMNRSIEQMQVVFYRPYGWAPAVRLELPGPIAVSNQRMSTVLDGIKRQFFSPAVTEPYPLFLADRMVKSLGAGVQVIEQAVAQHAVATSPEIESTLLCLQNYRTEGGRGS